MTNLFLGMLGAKVTSLQAPTLNSSIMGSAGLSQRNNSGESYIVPANKNARPITILESLQIDRENAPGEYKLDYIFKAFGAWFESVKNCFTMIALADGMQPEYANLYGDFTTGMGFETLGTLSISGFKSASGLSKGFTSESDIIAGTGFGNTAKGATEANWTRMTTKQATQAAKELGFEQTNFTAKMVKKFSITKSLKHILAKILVVGMVHLLIMLVFGNLLNRKKLLIAKK